MGAGKADYPTVAKETGGLKAVVVEYPVEENGFLAGKLLVLGSGDGIRSNRDRRMDPKNGSLYSRGVARSLPTTCSM